MSLGSVLLLVLSAFILLAGIFAFERRDGFRAGLIVGGATVSPYLVAVFAASLVAIARTNPIRTA